MDPRAVKLVELELLEHRADLGRQSGSDISLTRRMRTEIDALFWVCSCKAHSNHDSFEGWFAVADEDAVASDAFVTVLSCLHLTHVETLLRMVLCAAATECLLLAYNRVPYHACLC